MSTILSSLCCCLAPPAVMDCQEWEADRFGTCGHLATLPGSSWTGIMWEQPDGDILRHSWTITQPMYFQPSGVFGWIQDLSEDTPGSPCLDNGIGVTENLTKGTKTTKIVCGCVTPGSPAFRCTQEYGAGQFHHKWSYVRCNPVLNANRWDYVMATSGLGADASQRSLLPGCPTEAGPWTFGFYFIGQGSTLLDGGTFVL